MVSLLQEVKKDTLDRRAFTVTLTVAAFSGLLFLSIFSLFGVNVLSMAFAVVLMFAISYGNHMYLRRVESRERRAKTGLLE